MTLVRGPSWRVGSWCPETPARAMTWSPRQQGPARELRQVSYSHWAGPRLSGTSRPSPGQPQTQCSEHAGQARAARMWPSPAALPPVHKPELLPSPIALSPQLVPDGQGCQGCPCPSTSPYSTLPGSLLFLWPPALLRCSTWGRTHVSFSWRALVTIQLCQDGGFRGRPASMWGASEL